MSTGLNSYGHITNMPTKLGLLLDLSDPKVHNDYRRLNLEVDTLEILGALSLKMFELPPGYCKSRGS